MCPPTTSVSLLPVYPPLQRDGQKIQSATVSGISPAHGSASYTATGLLPGEPYQFTVTPK